MAPAIRVPGHRKRSIRNTVRRPAARPRRLRAMGCMAFSGVAREGLDR
jgi:hypothetical protein